MRDGAVDGLRGWAALMVVCYHFTWERLGARYPILRNPVTAWFLNGDFAVSIFFVLSGIALTSGYFTNGDRRILVGLAVKRYSRLTIPILVTCFLTFALYQLGLTYCGSASVVVARPDWIGSWLSEPVTLLRWAQDSLAEVYIIRNHTTALNAFLWTMQVEMWASFAIFAGLLARNARDYIWITLILAFAIAGLSIEIHPFVLFGFGAAFSFATSRRGAATLTGHRLCQVSALAIMTIVAAIQSWAHVNGANEAIAAYSGTDIAELVPSAVPGDDFVQRREPGVALTNRILQFYRRDAGFGRVDCDLHRAGAVDDPSGQPHTARRCNYPLNIRRSLRRPSRELAT